MKPLFFFFLFLCFTSCQQEIAKRSENVIPKVQKHKKTPPISENHTEKKVSEINFSTKNITYSIFQNKDTTNGYGYDIAIDGKTYIHQPHIPAVSGNSGFATKEKASIVARFIISKIKNNIIPPTVSMTELDSLQIFD